MGLSGRTLPGFKACCEYFRSANAKKNGFSIDLEEMGWVLGTSVLYKNDNDIVIGVLKEVLTGLEADKMQVLPVKDGESPIIRINGKRYSESCVDVDLDFLNNYTDSISYSAKSSSRSSVFHDREALEDSLELKAFDSAFSYLNQELRVNLNSRGIKSEREENNPKYLRYSLEVFYPNNKIVESIIASVEYIQKAVNMTNALEEIRKNKFESLVEKISRA